MIIQFGFLEKAQNSDLTNKVGGYPYFLNKPLDPLFCMVCDSRLELLLQLCTPEEKDILLEDGLYGQVEINRLMHVFACPRNHE